MVEMATNLRSEASDPYGMLRDRVMIYAGPNAHVVESGLYAQGDGVVLHGAGGAQLARHLEDAGFEGPVLWDPERYQPGQSPVSEGLFNENDEAAANQKLLGVDAFLSPSILPPSDDSDAIRKLLDEGYRFLEAARTVDASMPGFVVLPLTPRWLSSWSDSLIADVEESGLPLALVLAAAKDPLDRPEAIQTVLELVAVAPQVMALRCDSSAIGVVACGALAGAIGTSSSVRHLFLPRRGGGPPPDDAGYVFVTQANNWMKRSTIEKIPPDHDATKCPCPISGGRSVHQYFNGSQIDRTRAERHDVLAWSMLKNEILGEPGQRQRANAWRERCKASLRVYETLKEDGVDVSVPGFLVGWSAWQL
jgi:hypothetical protein